MLTVETTISTEAAKDTRFQADAFKLLASFVAQRPGLDPRDYDGLASYRRESRNITRDRRDFETLLTRCSWSEFSPGQIRDAFRNAFSGRLVLTENAQGLPRKLEYCTGQYFPTEYRKAACAVLASLLWAHVRDRCMPAPVLGLYDRMSAGDWLHRYFRREFGHSLARRWFN